VKLYTKAAEQGDRNAQNSLGAMYTEGKGVKQDNKKGVKLYTKAAEQGHSFAQFNLGAMYYQGDGVKQNKLKAYKFLDEGFKTR